MSNISNRTIKLMAKIYLGNMLNNIELDNDTSEGRQYNKITDDDTFRRFVLEFNKQTFRLNTQLTKELGFDIPSIQSLNTIFELGKEVEYLRKD